MFTHIKDLDREILYRAEDKDILQVCSVNKYTFNKLCDDTFFHNLLLRRYPHALQPLLDRWLEIKGNRKSKVLFKSLYLKILDIKNRIKKMSQQKYRIEFHFTDGNIILYYTLFKDKKKDIVKLAAIYGLKDLLNYMLKVSEEKNNITISFTYLFDDMVWGNKFNSKEIDILFQDKEISLMTYNLALSSAAKNQNKELINYMLQKGADVNYGLYGACQVGDGSLIRNFLRMGATNISRGAEYAVYNESEETVLNTLKYLKSIEINIDTQWNWSDIKLDAAGKGYLKVLQIAEDHGADDLDEPMKEAMANRRWNVIDYLIERGFNNYENAYIFAKDVLHDPSLTIFFSNF